MKDSTYEMIGSVVAFIVGCVGCFFAAILVLLILSILKNTGDGEKVGQIVKLSKQGVFFKTYEAEIIRGSLNNGSGVMGKSFDFTVPNDALVKKVQEALEAQKTVKIHYHIDKLAPLTSSSNATFLDSIEVV